jgi:hypothetical protein
MNHKKIGWLLVLFALSVFTVFYLSFGKAHASTATTNDYQRLNACTNALIVYGKDYDKNQWSRAVECAAIGKAVSHIESAKGTSYYAKTRRNLYGIRYWDKNGKPHIKSYKTYMAAHEDFARIYFTWYEGLSHKKFAARYSGEPFIVKAYTAHLNKWVPEYRKLYQSLTK